MKKANRPESGVQSAAKGQGNRGRGRLSDESHHAFYSKVYDKNSDTEEDIFLQPHRPKEEYLEKQLEPGDTLQTLSIQFNCPIAELKRINNIHRDNEVFARRIIKVPVKYYSLLSEKLVGVHRSSAVEKENLPIVLDNTANIPSTSFQAVTITNSLFNERSNSVEDIVQLLSKDLGAFPVTDPVLEDVIEYEDSSLLPPSSPLADVTVKDVFQCSGSDWGLSWPQLLTFTLLLLLGGPILYLLLSAESGGLGNNSIHHNTTNNTKQTNS